MDKNKQDSWIEQLEVTKPINGIIEFVDTLSSNYETRLTQLQAEFRHDVEELLACYKNDKAHFEATLAQDQAQLEQLRAELGQLQLAHSNECAAHIVAKESLRASNARIEELLTKLDKERDIFLTAIRNVQDEYDEHNSSDGSKHRQNILQRLMPWLFASRVQKTHVSSSSALS